MNVWRHRIRSLLGCTFSAGILLLHGAVQGADANDVVVTIDRTTRAWSDLAMGAPSSEDDADQSRGAKVVFSYVPAYGKPHADAGARGLDLPRLNDGKSASNGDDPGHSTWFDTKGHSRVLVDLGGKVDLFPQLPRTLEWFKVEDCRIAQHRLKLEQRRIGGQILTTITHTAGDAPLAGGFWLPAMAGTDVTQNGLPVKGVLHPMQPSGTNRASLPFELPPGARMKIEHADR